MLDSLLINEPKNKKAWLDYAHSIEDRKDRAIVLARASTKLADLEIWKEYIDLRVSNLKDASETEHLIVRDIIENALLLFPKEQPLWLQYMDLYPSRRAYDRALQRIDNSIVWPRYLEWAEQEKAPDVFERYTQYDPEAFDAIVDKLVDLGCVDEAVTFMKKNTDSDNFGRWQDLMVLVTQHNVEKQDMVFESALSLFPENDGWLVPQWALYLSNLGLFYLARSKLEDGLMNASSLIAFTQIFDATTQLMESLIAEMVAQDHTDAQRYTDIYSQLLDRHELMLSDVLIRTEPNIATHWLSRATLWSDIESKAEVYVDAIEKINSRKCPGLSDIWLDYAKLYIPSEGQDLDSTRAILENATKVHYSGTSDLIQVWLGWAAIEKQIVSVEKAIKVLEVSVRGPENSSISFTDDVLSPQERIHKSLKLWTELANLVASQGPKELAKLRRIYERTFNLKIATAATFLSFAATVASFGYVEESYRIYERGIASFSPEIAYEIWIVYLTRVASSALPLERIRDLFDVSLRSISKANAASICKVYLELEKRRGTNSEISRAFNRAVSIVSETDLAEIFDLYLEWAHKELQPVELRPIYQEALDSLEDEHSNKLAIEFAELEIGLGDVTRARAIYDFASQFNDPETRKGQKFWTKWTGMENDYGDESTMKKLATRKAQVSESIKSDVYMLAQREKDIAFTKGDDNE